LTSNYRYFTKGFGLLLILKHIYIKLIHDLESIVLSLIQKLINKYKIILKKKLSAGNYLKCDKLELHCSSDQFNYLAIFKSNFLFIIFTDKVIETFTQLQSCNKIEIIIIVKKPKILLID
jgi:hypothetical protein